MKRYLSIMALFLIITLFPSCGQLNTSVCDECGSHSLGNKNFCSECGANLYKVETQETTQEIFQETAEAEAIEVTKEVTLEVTREITQEITQEVTQETTYETTEERTKPSKLSAVEIYDSTSPSVVAITAISTYSTSSGTGFFYSESIIVTNYHVIEGCSSAYVTLPNGEKYTVIGVIEHTSGILENVAGEFLPEIIYIPYTSMQQSLHSKKISQISLKLKNTNDLEGGATALVKMLNQQKGSHNIKYTNLTDQRKNFSNILNYASIILFIIACITLLVAGIAVMTTMFSSINERKHEIGSIGNIMEPLL